CVVQVQEREGFEGADVLQDLPIEGRLEAEIGVDLPGLLAPDQRPAGPLDLIRDPFEGGRVARSGGQSVVIARREGGQDHPGGISRARDRHDGPAGGRYDEGSPSCRPIYCPPPGLADESGACLSVSRYEIKSAKSWGVSPSARPLGMMETSLFLRSSMSSLGM